MGTYACASAHEFLCSQKASGLVSMSSAHSDHMGIRPLMHWGAALELKSGCTSGVCLRAPPGTAACTALQSWAHVLPSSSCASIILNLCFHHPQLPTCCMCFHHPQLVLPSSSTCASIILNFQHVACASIILIASIILNLCFHHPQLVLPSSSTSNMLHVLPSSSTSNNSHHDPLCGWCAAGKQGSRRTLRRAAQSSRRRLCWRSCARCR